MTTASSETNPSAKIGWRTFHRDSRAVNPEFSGLVSKLDKAFGPCFVGYRNPPLPRRQNLQTGIVGEA